MNPNARSQMEKYTHRNGESEKPTVAGQYWFKGGRFHALPRFEKEGYTELHEGIIYVTGNGVVEPFAQWTGTPPLSWDGQWWGPIIPPWEQTISREEFLAADRQAREEIANFLGTTLKD